LLGDWLGARTWLEDRGVFPSVTFVTDALGNPTGGKEQGFKGSFEISFSERFGTSLSIENIGNVFSVQQVFGGETYRLVDVAYRQRLLAASSSASAVSPPGTISSCPPRPETS